MRTYYTQATRTQLRDEIKAAHVCGRLYEKVTGCNVLAQIIIYNLTTMEIPFKVLQMGAGVKKITTDVTTCPKCKGLGKC